MDEMSVSELTVTEEHLHMENADLRALLDEALVMAESYRLLAQVALAQLAEDNNDSLRDLRRENAELRALVMMQDMQRAA